MTHLRTLPQSSNSEYISQHDQAVVARLKNLSANQGLGEEVYYPGDEDMAGILQDFGLASPDPRD
jgi:hypothetical protein